MKKSAQKGYEFYLRLGMEKLLEEFIFIVLKESMRFGNKIMPTDMADLMNEVDEKLQILDKAFTDDIGKLELLIDIYESLDFDLEYDWEEDFTEDDFFENMTHTGFIDIMEDTPQCLDMNGNAVDGVSEEWYSRIVHKRFQPCRYARTAQSPYLKIQFLGLYRRLEIINVHDSKVSKYNPYGV